MYSPGADYYIVVWTNVCFQLAYIIYVHILANDSFANRLDKGARDDKFRSHTRAGVCCLCECHRSCSHNSY